MADEVKLPFHSFKFSLIEGTQPRSQMSLRAPEDGGAFYQLSVVRGSASNPLSSFNREVPVSVALELRDTLQALGMFDWEETYGDTTAPGSRRWSVTLVFQKDVFSISARGGSDVPPRFNEMLEALYRLDFPRPAAPRAESADGVGEFIGGAMGAMGVNSVGSMSAGDLGAYAATKGASGDLSYLSGMFGAQGMPEELKDLDLGSVDAAEMQRLFAQAQQNPELFQQRMKEEYRHMSPDEQESLLDMLASLGTATREWWRRFLNGD